MRDAGATILAVGGLLSAAIGSVDPTLSAWAARVMLVANLAVILNHLVKR